ncbi:hypothetical protein DICPUDRAFT_157320 [Dictyostelium purpureum]|uniref:Uncharacterized protein n=1 Tax=Dictyostelium purpureum TaxID=5786 RepID=F0ZYU1_DICPU|nr:uncharacterized protein DICPUDRAFT_157320 [Dictyostelium purpureum]EGC30888.1 hypothetical protein DICPUDRAFT_157320 [Dictyostelium purpureum]|eukprot:XP_003292593.1 hypothetical protein DICPUDRAFT_157320 [Dictyostelium purpureum]
MAEIEDENNKKKNIEKLESFLKFLVCKENEFRNQLLKGQQSQESKTAILLLTELRKTLHDFLNGVEGKYPGNLERKYLRIYQEAFSLLKHLDLEESEKKEYEIKLKESKDAVEYLKKGIPTNYSDKRGKFENYFYSDKVKKAFLLHNKNDECAESNVEKVKTLLEEYDPNSDFILNIEKKPLISQLVALLEEKRISIQDSANKEFDSRIKPNSEYKREFTLSANFRNLFILDIIDKESNSISDLINNFKEPSLKMSKAYLYSNIPETINKMYDSQTSIFTKSLIENVETDLRKGTGRNLASISNSIKNDMVDRLITIKPEDEFDIKYKENLNKNIKFNEEILNEQRKKFKEAFGGSEITELVFGKLLLNSLQIFHGQASIGDFLIYDQFFLNSTDPITQLPRLSIKNPRTIIRLIKMSDQFNQWARTNFVASNIDRYMEQPSPSITDKSLSKKTIACECKNRTNGFCLCKETTVLQNEPKIDLKR